MRNDAKKHNNRKTITDVSEKQINQKNIISSRHFTCCLNVDRAYAALHSIHSANESMRTQRKKNTKCECVVTTTQSNSYEKRTACNDKMSLFESNGDTQTYRRYDFDGVRTFICLYTDNDDS